MSAVCRSCGADVIWAETVTGKRMPIDAEPSPSGNLHYTTLPVPFVTAIGPPCPCDRHFMSHFATCPQAGKWRK